MKAIGQWKWMVMVAVLAILAVGCTTPSVTQQGSQATTETYQRSATRTVPYPLSQMRAGGWLERRLLKENLLRQNDPHRIAYVILLNNLGQPLEQFTIQGMVFSLNSQMTTADIVTDGGGADGTDRGNVTVAAPGDNGTWGPEPDGIGFFTTEGVEIKWNGLYLETDSPLNFTTKPVITYDASTAKPSVSAGGVKNVKSGGIAAAGS